MPRPRKTALHPKKKMSAKAFFKAFILSKRQSGSLSIKTIVNYESKLIGPNKKINVLISFKYAKVNFTPDFNPPSIKEAKLYLKKNLSQREFNHYSTALNSALHWGLEGGYFGAQQFDRNDIYVVKTRNCVPINVQVLSPEQINILMTKKLGKSRFKHLQNYLIFVVFDLQLGIRNGIEILKINVADVDLKNHSVKIIRENGQEQIKSFRKDNVPIFKAYLFERNKLLAKATEKGINAPGSEALIITTNPIKPNKMKDNNWKMETCTLIQQLNMLIEEYPELKGIKGGTLRHNACTNHQLAGMALNIPEGHISFDDNHLEKVDRENYQEGIAAFADIVNKLPEENIPYLEKHAFISLLNIFIDPIHFLRHLASLKRKLNILGFYQHRQELIDYRRRENYQLKLPEIPPALNKIIEKVLMSKNIFVQAMVQFSKKLWNSMESEPEIGALKDFCYKKILGPRKKKKSTAKFRKARRRRNKKYSVTNIDKQIT